jgi:hypothetical protein
MDGWGGTLGQAGVAPTKTGCAICDAGTYGSGNSLTSPCKSCKDAGPDSYSSAAGASTCAKCNGFLANPTATGCTSTPG